MGTAQPDRGTLSSFPVGQTASSLLFFLSYSVSLLFLLLVLVKPIRALTVNSPTFPPPSASERRRRRPAVAPPGAGAARVQGASASLIKLQPPRTPSQHGHTHTPHTSNPIQLNSAWKT